jgi:hypothetical protein
VSEKEYIERGALIEFVKQNTPHIDGDTTMQCVERAMKAAPAADVVSKGVYEQVQWERDMAMQQLEEHGIPFCGVADDVVNVVRCKDCRFYGNEERHPYGGECEWFGALVERNNFCFYGERKEQT